MSTSKETINEEQKKDSQIVMQPKAATPTLKRKIVDVQVNDVKHVKIVEEKTTTQSFFCALCNKKLRFSSAFACRCKKSFCVKHRFFDQHGCTFDYKHEARSILLENNPKIAPKKISE